MKKNFLVIGLGRFGLGIVKAISELNYDVIAIDNNEKAVEAASQYIPHCAICDATRISALKELGINNVDHAIVAIGNNLQASLLTVINLKELNIKQITVRVDSEEYQNVMERIGATDVIIPEEASAIGLANQIVSDTFVDYYKINKDYSIVKLLINEDFKEQSLLELDTRNNFDINIMGIMRQEKFMQPKANDTIQANDIILVFGKSSKIIKLDHFLNK